MLEAAVLTPAHVSSRPPRGLSFSILVLVLVFSPLPFASVGAIWSQLYGVLLGVGLVAYVAQRWRANRGIPPLPKLPLAAGMLVFVVALWGYAQSVPGLLPSLHHPFWSQAAALLELPDMQGYLSLDPQQSFQVATRYLVYLSFALLVLWHARRQRNAELLLKIFVAAQGVYAVYGLAVYFSGLETILWFDKTAYRGVLTSTFVNRNSYATYAGLGVLASLALTLRFLRRTLSADASHRTKLRELIEALTTTGWLLPVVLVACFVAILLTESRMGLVACMIASAVLVGGWVSRLPAGQARTFGSLLLAVLLGLLTFNLLLSGGMTADRLARFFEQGDGRFDVYPLVWQAISERPWTGYGWGAFESAFRAFRDASVGAFFTRATATISSSSWTWAGRRRSRCSLRSFWS